jgi:hypothetical protein
VQGYGRCRASLLAFTPLTDTLFCILWSKSFDRWRLSAE